MRAPVASFGIVLMLLGAGCLGAPRGDKPDEIGAWTESLFAPPSPGNLTERLMMLHARLANVSLAPYAGATTAFKANHTYPMLVENAGRDVDALLEREGMNGLLDAAVLAATIRHEHANLTCTGRHPLEAIETQGLALVRSLEGPAHAATARLAEAQLLLASRIDSAESFLQRDDCRSVYQRRAILLAVDLLGASRDDAFPWTRAVGPNRPDSENWTIPPGLPVHASQDLVQAKRAAPYCAEKALLPCLLYAEIVRMRTDTLASAYVNSTGKEELARKVGELDALARVTPPGEAARSIVADGRAATEAVRLAVAQVQAARSEADLLLGCFGAGTEDCPASG